MLVTGGAELRHRQSGAPRVEASPGRIAPLAGGHEAAIHRLD